MLNPTHSLTHSCSSVAAYGESHHEKPQSTISWLTDTTHYEPATLNPVNTVQFCSNLCRRGPATYDASRYRASSTSPETGTNVGFRWPLAADVRSSPDVKTSGWSHVPTAQANCYQHRTFAWMLHKCKTKADQTSVWSYRALFSYNQRC